MDTDRKTADGLALAATAVTIAVHLILTMTTQGPSVPFIAGAGLFWTGFIVVRARQNPNAFRDWGFRGDNLLRATGIPAALFLAGAAGLAVFAHFHSTLRVPAHLPLVFLLYCLWGVVQQFLALGIVVTNLERVPGLGPNKVLLTFLCAVGFGLIHAYDGRLAAGTFLLELVSIPLFFHYRNIWPLGVLHGWLGALFYLWVLNRDLWEEALR